jgi:hypothetical protein
MEFVAPASWEPVLKSMGSESEIRAPDAANVPTKREQSKWQQ